MEETMKDFEAQIDASFRTINEGDVITGTIIAIDEEEVTLDLQYYTQGIIKASDLSDDPNFSLTEDIHIGDSIEATVISVDDGHGNILLSKKEANQVLAWDILKSYMDEQKVLEVKISDTNSAGAIAYVEGIRGFIPASKLSLSYVEDTENFLNKTISVRIETVDADKEKLILSAKGILMEQEQEAHSHKVAMLVPGTLLDGIVESIQPYGAFVDIGDGLTGLVHISQISEKRLRTPSEVLKIGQHVRVKILNTNNGKISLSMKEAADDEAKEIFESQSSSDLVSNESVGTSLGDMFAKLNLNL